LIIVCIAKLKYGYTHAFDFRHINSFFILMGGKTLDYSEKPLLRRMEKKERQRT
jgi:hypothetical protein